MIRFLSTFMKVVRQYVESIEVKIRFRKVP